MSSGFPGFFDILSISDSGNGNNLFVQARECWQRPYFFSRSRFENSPSPKSLPRAWGNFSILIIHLFNGKERKRDWLSWRHENINWLFLGRVCCLNKVSIDCISSTRSNTVKLFCCNRVSSCKLEIKMLGNYERPNLQSESTNQFIRRRSHNEILYDWSKLVTWLEASSNQNALLWWEICT